jgi:CDGSH-type Zn-finger protein
MRAIYGMMGGKLPVSSRESRDMADKEAKKMIRIAKHGPYIVQGKIPLAREIIVSDPKGQPLRWKRSEPYPERETYALCRCGQSGCKPFCDGTHSRVGFDGTETVSRKKYLDQAETINGPDLILTDAEKLCAVARFCHRVEDAWSLTENSADPESKRIAVAEACDCPSGRLVAWDKKTGKPIEPEFEPSIGLIEHPATKTSGPIWVKGCVPVESSDGTVYETRNRVTLCRCGQSKNKPFCDGTHFLAGFSAGDKAPKK